MVEQRLVDWDGLVYYDGKIKKYTEELIEDCLKSGGEVSFTDLPRPCYKNINYIYKIQDEFTSNEDFEQPGIAYKAGCFVQVSDFNKDSTYRYVVVYEPNFASEDYVDRKILEAQFEGADLDLNNYYTKSEVDAIIPTVPTKVSELENDAGYITESSLLPYVQKSELPDFDEFATKKFVNDAIDAASTQEVNLSNYYNKDEVNSLIDGIDIPEIPTNVSAFTNDANYATKKDVADAISNIDLNDAQNFVTTEDLHKALGTKANEIPFTKNYTVTKDVGGFTSGDVITKDMTLTNILSLLLGLVPEQSSNIVETIVTNEIPAYVGTSSSGTAAASYQNLEINDKAFDEDGVTPLIGFYTNEDESRAGYQLQIPAQDDGDGAVILIPADAKVIGVYQWASLLNTWSSSDLAYFKIDGTVTHTVNNTQVVYNRYVWDEEEYGGVIYSESNWRFEIEV